MASPSKKAAERPKRAVLSPTASPAERIAYEQRSKAAWRESGQFSALTGAFDCPIVQSTDDGFQG